MRSYALIVGLCCAALGCGDDGEVSPQDSGTPSGEPCPQEGQTQTGCDCGGATRGVRHCSADLIWEPCECPPERPGIECVVGRPVVCAPCPGTVDARVGSCAPIEDSDAGPSAGEARCPRCDVTDAG